MELRANAIDVMIPDTRQRVVQFLDRTRYGVVDVHFSTRCSHGFESCGCTIELVPWNRWSMRLFCLFGRGLRGRAAIGSYRPKHPRGRFTRDLASLGLLAHVLTCRSSAVVPAEGDLCPGGGDAGALDAGVSGARAPCWNP
jgi:hypothetical protein